MTLSQYKYAEDLLHHEYMEKCKQISMPMSVIDQLFDIIGHAIESRWCVLISQYCGWITISHSHMPRFFLRSIEYVNFWPNPLICIGRLWSVFWVISEVPLPLDLASTNLHPHCWVYSHMLFGLVALMIDGLLEDFLCSLARYLFHGVWGNNQRSRDQASRLNIRH